MLETIGDILVYASCLFVVIMFGYYLVLGLDRVSDMIRDIDDLKREVDQLRRQVDELLYR